ncbi:hypothetical protein BH09PLA1_BH09PLA1_13300 [soil metagenome]
MSICHGRLCGAVVVCLICLAVSPALAGFTTVNPPPGSEKSVKQILEHVYGGLFTPSGVDYDSPTIHATRINDTPDGGNRNPVVPLSLIYDQNALNGTNGFQTDQLWTADQVDAEAQARFAVFTQEFGFAEGTGAVNYQHLLYVNGSGFNNHETASLDNMSNRIWRWARSGENGTFTSQNSDNPASVDHMITYRIDSKTPRASGPGIVTTYLLFFEDLKPNQNPDMDFNDMVVEIRARSLISPEPASLGLLALGGLIGLRRNRRATI